MKEVRQLPASHVISSPFLTAFLPSVVNSASSPLLSALTPAAEVRNLVNQTRDFYYSLGFNAGIIKIILKY